MATQVALDAIQILGEIFVHDNPLCISWLTQLS